MQKLTSDLPFGLALLVHFAFLESMLVWPVSRVEFFAWLLNVWCLLFMGFFVAFCLVTEAICFVLFFVSHMGALPPLPPVSSFPGRFLFWRKG